jgi:GGDEF domain-containing protein
LGNILIECVPIENGQVGHIGGDDFIVILTCEDWYHCCEVILEKFKNIISKHYKEDDLKAGGINAESRYGEKRFYPLISLSIGVVDPSSTAKCKSYVDIADLAAKAKKQSKKIEGNSLYVNESLYTS